MDAIQECNEHRERYHNFILPKLHDEFQHIEIRRLQVMQEASNKIVSAYVNHSIAMFEILDQYNNGVKKMNPMSDLLSFTKTM